MGDGLLGKCKECAKRDTKERETRLRKTDPAWAARERSRCRIKSGMARLMGKLDSGSSKSKRAWCLRNKHKRRAHLKVNRAVKSGIITKPTRCNRCGVYPIRIQAHHADYSKPLAVEWLCSTCHGIEHRKDK